MRGIRLTDGGSLWDAELVTNVAFHPRKCQPSSKKGQNGSGWMDSSVNAKDGTCMAYRLYTAPHALSLAKPLLLVHFHANAELCTDLETDAELFYDCGFQAVLCPEYRGYAWSGGKPRLTTLYSDAEDILEALPQILAKAGFQGGVEPVLVVHGRSLGSACAVHLAAKHGERFAALVVESGVMSLLDLPMVQQLGAMMPQMKQMLLAERNPVNTLAEMRQVKTPTLIIHGERDEMSPVEQAIACHRACGSSAKKLLRYPQCHHNDVRVAARKDYSAEFRMLCQAATSGDFSAAMREPVEQPSGFMGFLSGALMCFPGMRRCLSGNHDMADEEGRPSS